MVSHVHYPDFKGGGEKIYMASKIFALIVFGGILYFGRAVVLPAVFTAIFATYALFGIINHTIAATACAKEG
jgi:CDP-diacylglycerol-serine O-phosphatidyltransferase